MSHSILTSVGSGRRHLNSADTSGDKLIGARAQRRYSIAQLFFNRVRNIAARCSDYPLLRIIWIAAMSIAALFPVFRPLTIGWRPPMHDEMSTR